MSHQPNLPQPPLTLLDKRKNRTASQLVKKIYIPRIIGLSLALVVIATSFWHSQVSIGSWVFLFFWSLIWPHLAFIIASRSPSPFKVEVKNLFIDAFVIGFFVPLMSFAPVPTAAIMSMHLLSLISLLGFNKMALGFFTELVGIAVAIFIFGYQVNFNNEISPILASIPLLVIYPLFVGYTNYCLTRQLTSKQSDLRKLSRTDSLTGLYNRRFCEEKLARCFSLYQRVKTDSSLIFIDVDFFKVVNDTHGHVAGDTVLKNLATLILNSARATDYCCRYGGEEFCIVAPSLDKSGASRLAERLRVQVEESLLEESIPIKITISSGIAEINDSMNNYSDWLKCADDVLYQAKDSGRNKVVVYD